MSTYPVTENSKAVVVVQYGNKSTDAFFMDNKDDAYQFAEKKVQELNPQCKVYTADIRCGFTMVPLAKSFGR